VGPPIKVQEKNLHVDSSRDLGYTGIMTTLIIKDKKYKLPFEINTHSSAMVKRTNPLSGESIDLPGFAAAVYDHTMRMNLAAEEKDRKTGQPLGFSDNQNEWQIVRNGLDFFRRYFAKEYMVLLD
jgi:hypothetical protein